MSVENTCSRAETPLARDINSIDWSWFFCSKQLTCYKHSANRCWHQCCSVKCWFLKCNNSNWATVAGPTHGLAWLHDAQWQLILADFYGIDFFDGVAIGIWPQHHLLGRCTREKLTILHDLIGRLHASEKPTCSCSFCTNDMTLANHMWPMMRQGYLTPPPSVSVGLFPRLIVCHRLALSDYLWFLTPRGW